MKKIGMRVLAGFLIGICTVWAIFIPIVWRWMWLRLVSVAPDGYETAFEASALLCCFAYLNGWILVSAAVLTATEHIFMKN